MFFEMAVGLQKNGNLTLVNTNSSLRHELRGLGWHVKSSARQAVDPNTSNLRTVEGGPNRTDSDSFFTVNCIGFLAPSNKLATTKRMSRAHVFARRKMLLPRPTWLSAGIIVTAMNGSSRPLGKAMRVVSARLPFSMVWMFSKQTPSFF
jgi:hypothetical protein